MSFCNGVLIFRILENATSIEDTGVASVYDDAFARMEESLAQVKRQLESANITKKDIENLQSQMDGLSNKVFLTISLNFFCKR